MKNAHRNEDNMGMVSMETADIRLSLEGQEQVILQYKNDTNLQQRINIHDYSTATVGWYPWLFGKINLKPDMKILEVGCGNAAFWKNVSDKLPKGLEIHLTDYSKGMLEKAGQVITKMKQNGKEEAPPLCT